VERDRTRIALFRPLDLLVFLLVAGLALSLFLRPLFLQKGATLAVVTREGTAYYDLDADRTISLVGNGYSLTVVIASGEAFVQESDCPEQVCRRTGRITHPGESILCSRAGILLRIEGEGMYDGIAG
jgi:hypothetical protein